MPKYIDMLRSHQSGVKTADPDPVSATKNKTEKETPARKRKSTTEPDIWLSKCSRLVLSILKTASMHKFIQADKLRLHLQPQLKAILEKEHQLSALELKVSDNTQRTRDMSEGFGGMLEKAMNMLLLSVKMGLQLKMQEEQILALMLASILHHVGLAGVPLAVRQKTSALTREERHSIRNAVQDGVRYLHDCGIEDEYILTAITQSQERIDGSGPLALKGDEISDLARIVGLLSFFEALVHYRPYRQRMLPRDAIREIILHHKPSFDNAFLKALIDAISLYPIGTYVQLNSGDIGKVIDVHPRLPLRPVVLLCMDNHRQPITNRKVDLQEQTTLLVEQCMYPEDLDLAI